MGMGGEKKKKIEKKKRVKDISVMSEVEGFR